MSLPVWLQSPDPRIFTSEKYVVLDFETTNRMKGNACDPDNRLLLARWIRNDDPFTVHETRGSEYEMGRLLADLEWADFFVAHNAKFELKWLHRCGADLTKLLAFDTMIAEYVLAGNRKWSLGLGEISQRRGFGGKDPYVDICMKGEVCPSELPYSFLSRRCAKDVQQTREIFLQQKHELDEAGLLPVFFTRCIFTPVLADMELNGMVADHDRVAEEHKRLIAEKARLDTEMSLFTGGINPRSVPQMREFLYETLKFKPLKIRGKETFGTDAATLAKLKATNKKQRAFIELRKEHSKVNALLTKAVEFLYGAVVETHGLFYAQFNQTITKTHRLSSSGIPVKYDMFDKPKSVQFQNFPRQYKRLFKARKKGWLIGEIDGAQLEFRVAAFLGDDKQAKADIRDGVDVHTFTATTITAAGQETSRQDAKPHTFKPLYGGQSGTKAEQAYYTAFKEKYSGVAQEQSRWINAVVKNKSLRLVSGLILYWPQAHYSPSGYVAGQEQICNAPVQSLATAEMMPIAITYMWHRMKAANMESFLVSTIHDSVIGEIHPEEMELFVEYGVQSFTTDTYAYLESVYGLEWDVPMGAGCKIGPYWGESDEPVVIDRVPEGCRIKVDGGEVTYEVG